MVMHKVTSIKQQGRTLIRIRQALMVKQKVTSIKAAGQNPD